MSGLYDEARLMTLYGPCMNCGSLRDEVFRRFADGSAALEILCLNDACPYSIPDVTADRTL